MLRPSRRAALEHTARGAAALTRAAAMIVRLFGDWKKPNPSPHTAVRQIRPKDVPVAGKKRKQQQSRRHDQQSKSAKDTRGVAVPRGARDRGGDRQRHRPRRYEEPGLHGAVTETL